VKYWTRKSRSQRASRTQTVETLDLALAPDGSSFLPVLFFRVGETWHCFKFENTGEARVLLSSAQHVFRGVSR